MHHRPIEYAIACVVIPVVWGLIVYLISNSIERKLLGKPKAHADGPGENAQTLHLDYYI